MPGLEEIDYLPLILSFIHSFITITTEKAYTLSSNLRYPLLPQFHYTTTTHSIYIFIASIQLCWLLSYTDDNCFRWIRQFNLRLLQFMFVRLTVIFNFRMWILILWITTDVRKYGALEIPAVQLVWLSFYVKCHGFYLWYKLHYYDNNVFNPITNITKFLLLLLHIHRLKSQKYTLSNLTYKNLMKMHWYW